MADIEAGGPGSERVLLVMGGMKKFSVDQERGGEDFEGGGSGGGGWSHRKG